MDAPLTLDWLFDAITAEFGDAISALTGTATTPRAAEGGGFLRDGSPPCDAPARSTARSHWDRQRTTSASSVRLFWR